MKFHSSFQKKKRKCWKKGQKKKVRHVTSDTWDLSSPDFKWLFAKWDNICGIWKPMLAEKGSSASSQYPAIHRLSSLPVHLTATETIDPQVLIYPLWPDEKSMKLQQQQPTNFGWKYLQLSLARGFPGGNKHLLLHLGSANIRHISFLFLHLL